MLGWVVICFGSRLFPGPTVPESTTRSEEL
jgi:hypothetical protein